jgi:hypothetical protein
LARGSRFSTASLMAAGASGSWSRSLASERPCPRRQSLDLGQASEKRCSLNCRW